MDDLVAFCFLMICASLALGLGLLVLTCMIVVWLVSLPMRLSAFLYKRKAEHSKPKV